MASEEQLESTGNSGENPIPRSLHPHLKWWLEESNVITGQPLHPLAHALKIFTDASKEGWGAHLNEHMTRGSWSLPERKLHINYLELKAVLLALKDFQALCTNKVVLIATDTTMVAYINKEGGMKSGPLCALLWRILRNQVTLKAQHPRSSKCHSRQAIQTFKQNGPSIYSKQYATGGTDPKWIFLPPGTTTSFHSSSPQSQTPRLGQWMLSVCLGRDWTLTPSHQQPSWAKWWRSYSYRVAQHALVLGSSGNVQPNPTVPAQHTKLGVSTFQSGPSQEPLESESTCLAPRASAIKEQGFSEAVAARIEAPQRGSTRSVYEAK